MNKATQASICVYASKVYDSSKVIVYLMYIQRVVEGLMERFIYTLRGRRLFKESVRTKN